MSDKETAPPPLRGFVPKRTTSFQQHQKRIEQLLAEGMYGGKAWKDEAFARYSELEDAEAEPGTISEITFSNGGTTGATVIAQAVECTAPAPQPNQFAEALADLLQSMEEFRQGALSPGKLRIAMQKANDLLQPDLDEKNDLDTLRERDQRFDNSEEVKELRELNYRLQQLLSKREATPQVTPTPLEEMCDSAIDLAAELRVELRHAVMCMDRSCNKCNAIAKRFEGTSEQASPTPEKCPSCGSADHSGHIIGWAGLEAVYCQDSWHSSAGTPKGNKKD